MIRAGWKKDLFGNWIRDEDAEFDSDEEPPDLPWQYEIWYGVTTSTLSVRYLILSFQTYTQYDSDEKSFRPTRQYASEEKPSDPDNIILM